MDLSDIPFLYINVIALCSFCLIFITFLAAKKTPEIRSFILMMLGFIFWSSGSVLMRLQVYPGVAFWFYVSLLSLFALPLLIYFFVCSFTRVKGSFQKTAWTILTLALIITTGFGLVVSPPVVTTLGTETVYSYELSWAVLFPCVVLALIIGSIIKIFRQVIREKGRRTPGIITIITGCITVALGNLIQGLPGNIFPWDALSGIIFAVLIVVALYRKRMFRMTLLISRTLLTLLCALLCVGVAIFLISPAQRFLTTSFALSGDIATTVIIVVFAALLYLIYSLSKRLIDVLFIREEQQSRMLRSFSSAVTQSLNSGEIMQKMAEIIKSEISVSCVYICLPDKGTFTVSYSSDALAARNFSVPASSPCIKHLKKDNAYLLMSEFVNDPLYMSVWQEEKDLYRKLSIACIAALKDGEEIVGLVLLSERDKTLRLNYTEASFLETVLSLASIAIKNASLYEKMYREARLDNLTGIYNYRYFIERIHQEYKNCGEDCLALLYLDLDDFKLYNQLYGSVEGDKALRLTADAINLCVCANGEVFRSSSKVFAVLLPGFDGHRTEMLAREIQSRIRAINASPARAHLRLLTVSCGICVSPHAASSANELMHNADLATYNAKQAGKDKINIFRGTAPVYQRISDKALAVVERSQMANSAYQVNYTTIFALTAAIDAKDHYTYQHSRNVALYSAMLATAAGFNDEQISVIYEAGLLHDIGKISIPETILGKTSRLSVEEYEMMKGHVNSSIDMIRYLPAMDYVIPIAVDHHERWDGTGYPRGVFGRDITVGGRCLALADAFDAMTTDRPYRKGMPFEYAAKEIERCAGTHFDPDLANLFVRIIRSGEIMSAL